MISIPIAVNNEYFRWQLDLFWYNHRKTYGVEAFNKVNALVVERNHSWETPELNINSWNTDVPHTITKPYFENENVDESALSVPLNIQSSLSQIIHQYQDSEILEIVDCDVFHFRPHPHIDVKSDEIIVDDVYEKWHLRSLTTNKYVIEPYFENKGNYYNGGFIPIILRVGTLKRILPEWIAVHADIITKQKDTNIRWWAGMFALQVACEKAKIKMVAKKYCYISGENKEISNENYIGHYCCDKIFDKKKFSGNLQHELPENEFYNRIIDWNK